MQAAPTLGLSVPAVAGMPETAGHPWWIYWALAAQQGKRRADVELDARRRAFGGK